MKRSFRRFCPGLLLVLLSAVLAVYVEGLPRRPMPVLMYHHLVPDGEACNDMTVTVSKFRQDLEQVLALGYTPVLPGELAGERERERERERGCRKSPSSSPLTTATAAITASSIPF